MCSQINKRLYLIILYHIFQLILCLALKPPRKKYGKNRKEGRQTDMWLG